MFEERIFIMSPTAREQAMLRQLPDDPRSKALKRVQRLAKAYQKACQGTDEAKWMAAEVALEQACREYEERCYA